MDDFASISTYFSLACFHFFLDLFILFGILRVFSSLVFGLLFLLFKRFINYSDLVLVAFFIFDPALGALLQDEAVLFAREQLPLQDQPITVLGVI